jgi:hypothetical protein
MTKKASEIIIKPRLVPPNCPSCIIHKNEKNPMEKSRLGDVDTWSCSVCKSIMIQGQTKPLYWHRCISCKTLNVIDKDTDQGKTDFSCHGCKIQYTKDV